MQRRAKTKQCGNNGGLILFGKGRIFPEGGFPQVSRRQCRRVAQVRCLGRVIVFGGRTYLRTGGSVSCSDCVTYQPPLAEAEEALPAVLTSIPAVSVVVLGDYVRVTSGKRELQFLESLRMRGTCPFHAMGVINRSGSSGGARHSSERLRARLRTH